MEYFADDDAQLNFPLSIPHVVFGLSLFVGSLFFLALSEKQSG